MTDFVEGELAKEFKSWDLPFVESERKVDDGKTNAMNRSSDWKWEPPEEEEEIKPPTAEEIEAIRKAAYEDGFAQGKEDGYEKGLEEGQALGLEKGHKEGYEKGLEEGLTEGREIIQQQMEQWQALINSIQSPLSLVEQELEKELLQLSVSLARSVIKTETKMNENIIFQALESGLKVLPINEKSYQLLLHPDDHKLVKQHFSEDDIERHNWVLVESVSTTQGGCEIITDNNAVDLSLERRVRDVIDTFLMEQGLPNTVPQHNL
ncbi:MAG: flagellar assembly protein FliH [Alteromonadaceae bacterium]|nr:flagellar assembly protein FliH [Alteromonadaceae bacterium]